MGSSKIVVFIGVPLGGMRSSRVRRSEEGKGKSVNGQARLNQSDLWFMLWIAWLVEYRKIFLCH